LAGPGDPPTADRLSSAAGGQREEARL
jgi:hypothetical protein